MANLHHESTTSKVVPKFGIGDVVTLGELPNRNGYRVTAVSLNEDEKNIKYSLKPNFTTLDITVVAAEEHVGLKEAETAQQCTGIDARLTEEERSLKRNALRNSKLALEDMVDINIEENGVVEIASGSPYRGLVIGGPNRSGNNWEYLILGEDGYLTIETIQLMVTKTVRENWGVDEDEVGQ
jgi:hypothetical protein